MNCPKCGKDHDKVLESRSNKEGTSIRRRRLCLECGYRFTSYEHIERKPIVVIKKDGSHQTFELAKVERGIRTCTEKLPISTESIENTLREIEDEVYTIAQTNRNMITSGEIGEATLRHLYRMSPVAYVRFAAVYRAFDTLDQFISEIETLTH
jgi:transcriptional repressor NrdR